jgi:hypothetical protein
MNLALKDQIKKSHEEYRRGKARDAGKFLAELRRPARKAKRQEKVSTGPYGRKTSSRQSRFRAHSAGE